VSQTLQTGEIPIHWSQVPTGRPRLRVSQIKVPTLRGWELCHILVIICEMEEFWRFNCWMKEWMPRVWAGFLAL